MTETTPKPRTPRGPEKPETTFAKVVGKMTELSPSRKAQLVVQMRNEMTAENLRRIAADKLAEADEAFDEARVDVDRIEAEADLLEMTEKLTPEFRAALLGVLDPK